MVNDALGYYGGFQAINFVDTSGTIIWVIPYETNVEALGKSLFAHPDPLVPATFETIVIDGKIEGYIINPAPNNSMILYYNNSKL